MKPLGLLNRPMAFLPSDLPLLRDAVDAPGAYSPERATAANRDFAIDRGVAVIPVHGLLTHGSAWGCYYDETSYDTVRRCMAAAVGDDAVAAIVLHINSPGGDVAGMLDLSDAIYRMRGTKPIWAVLDESAYSAAYCLASAADRVTVPRTGGTGSIGVIALHCDVSGALDQAGVKVTTITFGARKADGNPTEPLSSDAQDRMQAAVNKMGNMFVACVARNRGISPGSIRAMEGGTFMGEEGVAAGLADEVLAPGEAFRELCASVPKSAAPAAGRAGER